jgi:hypothetical protein
MDVHSRFSVKDAGTDGLCFIIVALVSSGYSGVLQLNADNLMPCSAALPPLARGIEHLCTCAVPPTAAILELRFYSHPSIVLGRSKPMVYIVVVYRYQRATCVVQQKSPTRKAIQDNY